MFVDALTAPPPPSIALPTPPAPRARTPRNVADRERLPSALAGAALLAFGLGRATITRGALALVGGELLFRGVTGRCPLYKALGIDTASRAAGAVGDEAPIVNVAITIERPAAVVYELLRDPRRLAEVLAPAVELTATEAGVARFRTGALLGRRLEGEIALEEERPGERLRFRTRGAAALPFEATITLRPAPADRGTEVHLALRFEPPGGALGAWAARKLDRAPRLAATKALHRLKSLALVGEVPTLAENPAGAARGDA